MSRISDFNEKFLYTKTNPEGIIASPKGGWFFRKYNDFWVNESGDVDGTWRKLPYKSVILPKPPASKNILFEEDMELWIKNSNGFIDEYNVLYPKTDWKFYAYGIDVFLRRAGRSFKWFFPVPTSTSDPIGVDGSRSYDENYYYYKILGNWFRTPIALFSDTGTDVGEVPYWYNNLPFVDAPRKAPRPINPSDSGAVGEQSYDADYFYIKPSRWKRSQLIYFNPSKMAVF